jgi:hypothetical protein
LPLDHRALRAFKNKIRLLRHANHPVCCMTRYPDRCDKASCCSGVSVVCAPSQGASYNLHSP